MTAPASLASSADFSSVSTNFSVSVKYCIFDNNKAMYGSAVLGYVVDFDFNFFGFQNNVTEFPRDLFDGSIIPKKWVVLDISKFNDVCFVNFVLNDGSPLSRAMPDYDASLNINGVVKDISVKFNYYYDTYTTGNCLLTSINSGNVLANFTFNNNCSMNVSVDDITVGDVAHVVVTLPTDAIGYVDLYINDKYYGDSGVRNGVATFNISGLTPNKYIIKAVYSGDNKYSPTNASVNLTVYDIPEYDIEVNASGIYDDCING